MRIIDKKQILEEIYGACERCLVYPENPFTLDNPDVIAAQGSNLYAIYIPTYRENENMDHLVRRLFISQLSYGHKMIPVLFVYDDKTLRAHPNQVINQGFSHISYSLDDVKRYINQANPVKCRSKFFSEVQARQYISYRQYLQLSENAHKEIQTVFSAEAMELKEIVKAKSWVSDNERESKSYRRTNVGFVATVGRKKNTSFKTAFDQLMTMAFISKFNFDNGNIFPTGMFDELSVINTDWTMFDDNLIPNSYNHMLSFVGLAPVSISTDRDMEMVFEKFQNIRNYGFGKENRNS